MEPRVAADQPITFDAGVVAAHRMIDADNADASIRTGAATCLWSHGEHRQKAVLMLHGYTHDPRQMASLARHFFVRGYNVFVPRAPLHGLVDSHAHARITATGMRTWAAEAWAVTASLGEDTGVVGVSGGAVLATWLAQRPGSSVRRLLALAPFYRPHRRQVHPALAGLSRVLFGSGLLPDRRTSRGYSYAAVAQYLRIVAGYPRRPSTPGLSRVAVAMSTMDEVVDLTAALCLPAALARATDASFGMYLVPPGWKLGHDIVSPAVTAGHVDWLYGRYFALYDDPHEPTGVRRPGE